MGSYISIIGEHFLECLVSDRNYAHSHLINTLFIAQDAGTEVHAAYTHVYVMLIKYLTSYENLIAVNRRRTGTTTR